MAGACLAVCCDRAGARDLPRTLTGLVDKSVLTVEPSDTESRWRLLSTLRSFGQARLAESGDGALLLQRHAEWFLRKAVDAKQRWLTPAQRHVYPQMRVGLANFAAAYDHLLQSAAPTGDPTQALQMAIALRMYWVMAGRTGEGRLWLRRALAAARLHPPSPESAEAEVVAAYLAAVGNDIAAAASVADVTTHSDEAASLRNVVLGFLAIGDGRYTEAQQFASAAIDTLDRHAHSTLHREAAFIQCYALALAGDIQGCLALCTQYREAESAAGDRWGASYFGLIEALARLSGGDHDDALRLGRDAWDVADATGDQTQRGMAMLVIAQVLFDRGLHAPAALLVGHVQTIGLPLMLHTQHGQVDELLAALRVRHQHELSTGADMTPPELRNLVFRPTAVPAMADSLLSAREAEVAKMIAEGLTNQEIANKLVISKRTAEGHVQRVLAKAGTSRGQLAAWLANRR